MADAPERFVGRLPRLPAGAWKVQLRVTGGGVKIDDSIFNEVLVRQQVSQELANVSCNRELLTQLAELTNGSVVEPFEAQRLVSLIQPQDQPEEKLKERTLWGSLDCVIDLLFSVDVRMGVTKAKRIAVKGITSASNRYKNSRRPSSSAGKTVPRPAIYCDHCGKTHGCELLAEFKTLTAALQAGLGQELQADFVIVVQSYSDEFAPAQINDLIGRPAIRTHHCLLRSLVYGGWTQS